MTEHNSIFNPANSNRLEEISITIKFYENIINELKQLLEQKENDRKIAFNKMVKSDNTLDYFKQLLSKDAIDFEIRQLNVIIECQSRDLEKEKYYLRNALDNSHITKKRKLAENHFDLPQPSVADMFTV